MQGLTSGSQIVQLFRQAVPNHILRPVQEEYIKQVWWLCCCCVLGAVVIAAEAEAGTLVLD